MILNNSSSILSEPGWSHSKPLSLSKHQSNQYNNMKMNLMHRDTKSVNKHFINEKARTNRNHKFDSTAKTANHISTFDEKVEQAKSINIETKTRNKLSLKYDSNLKR